MDGAFFKIDYKPSPSLTAEERVRNFNQVLKSFSQQEASQQAKRCISCDSPGCNSGCPVGQQIPQFLEAASKDQWQQAHEIAIQSPLYGLFGSICPQQEGLCESSCTLGQLSHFGTPMSEVKEGKLSDTIPVGGIESFIWRQALQNDWLRYPTPNQATGQSVAIIGAGPAGLYAAHDLNRAGHKVTVFDAWDEVGGLLLKGIPDFKLAKTDLSVVREAFEDAGVTFQLNTRIGKTSDTPSLSELLRAHSAVVVTVGTYAARRVSADAATGKTIDGHSHIHDGLNYLFVNNDATRLSKAVPLHLNAEGKRVLVVGPGDTGMDCVRTALRSGAAEITILHRSSKLRGAAKERIYAGEESQLLQIAGTHNMRYQFETLPISVAERNGELLVSVRDAQGGTDVIPTDIILNATGFEKERHAQSFGLDTLVIHPNGTSSEPRLFFAGDALHGATLAVKAAQSAREVSRAVLQRLRITHG